MAPAIGNETLDAILGGRLKLIQPRQGYRFSVEAVLLARFARCRRGQRVLDLGAGCGVVSLLVATLYEPASVLALELQPQLAALIRRNAELNGLSVVSALNADLRAPGLAELPAGGFDLVVTNPPYRALETGRWSPDPQRRMARDESGASLAEFIAAAARSLRHGGNLAIVFTAARAAELITALRARRLEPKRIRMVHPRLELPASMILVEARKSAGVEVAIEPPLVLYSNKGVWSDEARVLLTLDREPERARRRTGHA